MTSRWLAACVLVIAACKNATRAPEPASNTKIAEPGSANNASGGAAPQAAPSDAALAPVPGTIDVTASTGSAAKPVIHGDKWQDNEEGGRNFAAFKETWVYVDGVP